MSPTHTKNNDGRPREPGFWNNVWYGRSIWSIVLVPLSWLFAAGVALRRAAFRRGSLHSERLTVPVIVVGNITVGGTGKTPVVAWLAGELAMRGRRPGIISRGYGGWRSREPQLVEPDSDAIEVGDEPLALRRTTGVPVCVCANRVRAGQALVDMGVDVLIADDGLQHYRLQRDLEVAVLDGERMCGNGRLLPAGPLRERPKRLDEVDLVLINGDTELDGALNFRLVPKAVESLRDGRRVDLHRFCGQRVWSVAGIGNPGRFQRMLDDAGIEAVPARVPDHGRVKLARLRQREAMPILMTEKDAVKVTSPAFDDLWFVSVELSMHSGSRAKVLTLIDEIIK